MNPILRNHDHTQVIGRWAISVDGRSIVGEFLPGQNVTREQLFEIFGGAGIRVLEQDSIDNQVVIRKFAVLEFSLCYQTAHPQRSDDDLYAIANKHVRDSSDPYWNFESAGLLQMLREVERAP